MEFNVPTLEELKKKAKSLPDDKFPSWIFNITFHQFDDFPFYWSDYDMSDPRAQKLQTLPKVKDVRDYLEYHRIWVEYIQDIADKYDVDPTMVPKMFRVGYINEYIPDEPQLSKKSKANKKFLKTGKLPFRKVDGAINIMNAYANEKIQETQVDPNEYGLIVREPTDAEREILEYGSDTIAAKKRMAEFKQPAIAAERHIEYVGEYFQGLSKGEYDNKPKEITEDGIDLDLVVKNAEEEESKPEFVRELEKMENTGTKWIGSRFVTHREFCERQVAAALVAAGVNPMALHEGGMMSKKQVYIVSSMAGINLDSLDNPKKWEKKKKKKEKKLMKRHMRKLGSMASLLTANGFTDGYGNMDDPISVGIDDEDLFKL